MRALTPILILYSVSISQAQDQPVPPRKDCGMCIAKIHTHTRPYEIKIKKEIPYLTTGIIMTSVALLAEHNNPIKPYSAEQVFALDRGSVNPFDRSATYNWSPSAHKASNILISTATFLPIIFIANHHLRSDLIPLAVMSAEVMLVNFGATILMKNLANRARPLTYNTVVPLEERTNATSRESFFSGHASHTTAASIYFAKVVTDYHPDMKTSLKVALWATMTTLPAVTAYLRVRAGKHFPTDVIVGYLVGGSIGYFIPHLHKLQARKSDPKVSVFPNVSPGSATLNMRIRL